MLSSANVYKLYLVIIIIIIIIIIINGDVQNV